ncbi:MAG: methylated-DNA--[protein]-cysteine S-methyltransferase [Chitinophagales bacterium]
MKAKIYTHSYKSPVGEILLGDFEGKLCLADWQYRKMRHAIDKRIQKGLDAEYKKETTPLLQETVKQFNEYFKKERQEFDLSLLFVGTDFQQKVWSSLCKIPYGTTNTYLGLSQKMDNEKAIRAVASANGANAISIIVPCHRIIGKNGALVGYAGGLPAKKKLLELEDALDKSQLSLF